MNNPLEMGKEAMAKRVLSQVTPSETPIGNSIANSITTTEHRLISALNSAFDTAEVDAEIQHDPQDRHATILSLADAVADQRVQDWWFEHVGAFHLDDHERAQSYVGMDGDEWREQLRQWYRQYRTAGVVDTPLSDADPAEIGDVADRHIRETFGIPLREFVAVVVNWSRGEQLEGVMFGPMQQQVAHVRQLEREIEKRDERIADLEEQVDDLQS